MAQNCCHFGKKLSLLITMECQSSDSFLCCLMTSLACWPIRVQRLKFSTLPQLPLNKSLRYALKKKFSLIHLFSVTHHLTFCLQVHLAISKKDRTNYMFFFGVMLYSVMTFDVNFRISSAFYKNREKLVKTRRWLSPAKK